MKTLNKKYHKQFYRHYFSWLLIYFFTVAGLNNSYSQSLDNELFILSDRVGSELDSNEIEYFNLFPNLDNVKSSVYRKDNFENLRMLVSLANGKDTTITFSKLATEQLSKLIDHFESLSDSSELVDWKLLPGYSNRKLNYYESTGRNVKVSTSEGSFAGRLLLVRDSSLCLWLKKGDFKPFNCQRFIKKIDPKTIKSIEIRPNLSSKLFGASLGAGLAIGALQLGYNVTDASDYVLSSNSILLLGLGALVGSVGGFFFDGISTIGRYKDVNQDIKLYNKVKGSVSSKAMFHVVFPPELKNYK
jgi:hypothetical protein